MILSSQVYIAERLKFMPIVNALLSLSGRVGKSAIELIKALGSTIDDLKTFQKEIKIDEEAKLQSFLTRLEARQGSAYEMDDISALVGDLIRMVKESMMKSGDSGVESVLIIDDLDRLDPEHTFRLFNIFTSHFDQLDSGNKFGFERVIFVCDIENIHKLYRHKYGPGVDFKGYIDKFYFLYPFDFDNRKYLREKIGKFLDGIQTNHTESARIFKYLVEAENRSDFFYVVQFVLLSLIEARALNLRTLVPSTAHNLPDYNFQTRHGRHPNHKFPILLLFSLLKSFYISLDLIKEKLVLLDNQFGEHSVHRSSDHLNLNDEYIARCLKSSLLPFLLPAEEGLEPFPEENDGKLLYSDALRAWLHYKISRDGKLIFIKATTDAGIDAQEVKMSSYRMLLSCFNECVKIKAIR